MQEGGLGQVGAAKRSKKEDWNRWGQLRGAIRRTMTARTVRGNKENYDSWGQLKVRGKWIRTGHDS